MLIVYTVGIIGFFSNFVKWAVDEYPTPHADPCLHSEGHDPPPPPPQGISTIVPKEVQLPSGLVLQ